MDENFDEKQAFEDLRSALQHIYNFANHYYVEMQNAQSLCNEKNKALEDLKRQYDADRVNAENRFNATVKAKDEKISELERKISAQVENFKSDLKAQEDSFKVHLQEYGNYNLQLTQELKELRNKRRAELDAREQNLKNREDKLKVEQETLAVEKATLSDERKKFNVNRNAQEEKISNYESMEKRIQGFDEERSELNRKINKLEEDLKTKDYEWQGKLNAIIDDKNTLQTQVNNSNKQLEKALEELKAYQNVQANNSMESPEENRDKDFDENNNHDDNRNNDSKNWNGDVNV